MNSREYWKKRELENLKNNLKTEEEYLKTINGYYDYMMDEIQKEINGFYTKYAKAEGISIAEARKRVSELDIKAYERKAKRYVKDKNFTKEANEEMRIYNATMKINRLEMLKANIGLELVDGFDGLQKYFEEILTKRTLSEFKRQAGILGKTMHNNQQAAHALVNSSFSNATYSDRIWMYQDMMKAELSKLLQQGLMQGQNPRKLATHLQKLFGASKVNAERLMRTELARVQTEAQKQSFERNGFEQYEYIALGSACDICKVLDGKHFDVKKMMPGENAPPMHPNCRCSVAAYIDDKEYEAWLDFLDKGGTTDEWNNLKSIRTLNLQYFAESNKQSVLQKIKEGVIDGDEFRKCYDYFKDCFKEGIETPIGKVLDSRDRFYHIVDRHQYMMSKDNIDRIKETISKPKEIRLSKDKFGNRAVCYIEDIGENTLIVIDRNGIITSYEPNTKYLHNIMRGELLWEKN